MPSPLDRPAIQGVDAIDIEKVIERPSDDKVPVHSFFRILRLPSHDQVPFSALAFKIMNDPFVGTLTFTRIYSGVLLAGSSVRNSVKGKTERIGRMLQMHGTPSS